MSPFVVRKILIRVAAFVIISSCAAIFQKWNVTELVTENIQLPLDYKIRKYLGRSPKINPKLKVFTFDDRAVHLLGQPQISTSQWAHIIARVANQKPAAIVIDKMFSVLPGTNVDIQKLVSEIKRSPVYVGASESVYEIPWRHSVDQVQSAIYTGKFKSYKNQDFRYVYGPNQQVAKYFSGIGHISAMKHGLVRKSFVTKKSNTILALSLLPFAKESFVESLPNFLVVDFPNIKDMYYESYSLAGVLTEDKSSRIKDNIDRIQPGDYVLILPEFYTGNADLTESPFGRVPAGLVQYALLNSAMNRNFSTDLRDYTLFTIVFSCLVILLISFSSRFSNFVYSWVCALMACPILGVAFFTFADIRFPYVYVAIYLFVFGVVILALQAYQQAMFKNLIGVGLAGANQSVELFVGIIQKLRRQPMQTKSAIMFVDIVGFSQFCSNNSSKEVFAYLSMTLKSIAALVRKHGGLIDRTLGDGCLCVFGVSLGQNPSGDYHSMVSSAVECAKEIQAKFMVVQKHGLKLRIGLHFGDVIVGDLGDSNRLDLTVISKDVNFAKRIESATTPGRVGYSLACDEFIKNAQHWSLQKLFTIKNESNLTKMYEILGPNDLVVDLTEFILTKQSGSDSDVIGARVVDSTFGPIGFIWTESSVFYGVSKVYPQQGIVFKVRREMSFSTKDKGQLTTEIHLKSGQSSFRARQDFTIFEIEVLGNDPTEKSNLRSLVVSSPNYAYYEKPNDELFEA